MWGKPQESRAVSLQGGSHCLGFICLVDVRHRESISHHITHSLTAVLSCTAPDSWTSSWLTRLQRMWGLWTGRLLAVSPRAPGHADEQLWPVTDWLGRLGRTAEDGGQALTVHFAQPWEEEVHIEWKGWKYSIHSISLSWYCLLTH